MGFQADLLIDSAVLPEIKAVTALLAAHDAQIPTYLRMRKIQVGLLMNFHAVRLKDGLQRFVVSCSNRFYLGREPAP